MVCHYTKLATIREYGSTLYVGLACAVPPTNTNFQPLLLPTQVSMPYTNTHKHRTSYFKSTLTFMGPAKRLYIKRSCSSVNNLNRETFLFIFQQYLNVYNITQKTFTGK